VSVPDADRPGVHDGDGDVTCLLLPLTARYQTPAETAHR